jgi:hypothetical protein
LRRAPAFAIIAARSIGGAARVGPPNRIERGRSDGG